ncbi:ribonuclease T2 family protein [Oceaniglobus roseus]|uniref:ribonuclease T2 family protein n=1 Tax=Oceaniglobus roseus TaxID=1737570 RepID=UPI000C7F43D0|nr:ribonuclease T2 [Kandeliimicrobium roseum]
MRVLLAALLFPTLLRAEGEPAGHFDYYVISLSWSPTWCALEGDARKSPQCDDAADSGWVLHGLWPQFHQGYPSFCRTTAKDPSRAQTAAMADIMGDGGAAWYQWKKHGRCAGLSAEAYFALARRAFASVAKPEVFRKLDRAVKLPAAVVEDAFLKENPGLAADGITITCKAGRIQEARVCLSKDLAPVPCGRDVVRDCRTQDALFDPVR